MRSIHYLKKEPEKPARCGFFYSPYKFLLHNTTKVVFQTTTFRDF